jgi:hypothetical protein
MLEQHLDRGRKDDARLDSLQVPLANIPRLKRPIDEVKLGLWENFPALVGDKADADFAGD